MQQHDSDANDSFDLEDNMDTGVSMINDSSTTEQCFLQCVKLLGIYGSCSSCAFDAIAKFLASTLQATTNTTRSFQVSLS